MVDMNRFKALVKQWIKDHPAGTTSDLRDYCEEQIPAHQFTSCNWLIDQTVDWYKHILHNREHQHVLSDDSWDEVD
jgi:hypothetical protein